VSQWSGFETIAGDIQMKNNEHIREFLGAFVDWASDQPDVQAMIERDPLYGKDIFSWILEP